MERVDSVMTEGNKKSYRNNCKYHFDVWYEDAIFGGKSMDCYIDGPINKRMVMNFADLVGRARKSKLYEDNVVDQIVINYSSWGGLIYYGFQIVNIIDKFNYSSKIPIKFMGTGLVASMGLVVFVSGMERACFSQTKFLYHQMSSELDGGLSDLQRAVEHLESLQNDCDRELAKRTKMTKKYLQNISKNGDKYIDSDEAIKLGIVQYIW